ncbi:MAG TPA: urea ABC transporter permease subunit UrtC [Opitutaceae bacterium]|nr:urea ABC transporter permease subunit UrtC [Opitutaceae bacterium]
MTRTPLFSPGQWIAFAVITMTAGIVLPLLNLYLPSGHFLHVTDFTLNLYGKYLTLAVLAIGVDLLWGYTGLLSLGQALFFALGGYAMGMHLMLMIGKLGQYKSDLPDFMVFLGYAGLPTHWKPFYSFPFALFAACAVPAVVAGIFGYLAFRSRIKGVYFSILTQALTYAAALLFFRNDFTFGGNNGLTDFKTVLGYGLNEPATRRTLYVLSVVLLTSVFLVGRWLSLSRFGLIQRAVRDSENRVLFSGYATVHFKLFIFVLCAMISGMGGALYVCQVGIINPSEMMPEKSLEAIVWVAVGGRGTLVGPIVGAITINALKSWATRAYPDLWLIVMGSLFILVVLFLPGGIVSIPSRIAQAWKRRKGRSLNPPVDVTRTEVPSSVTTEKPSTTTP